MRRCGGYSLRLAFNDGCSKRVNLLPLLQKGAHRQLRDPAKFSRVRLDRSWGTLCWPGELDVAPEALRELPEEAEPQRRRATRRRIAR